MRHSRLLVLCALIAAALIWLYFVLPRNLDGTPAPAVAKVEKPAAAAPSPRELAKSAAAVPAPAPPVLPPTVPIAAPVVPPAEEAPPEEPEEEEPVAEEEPPKTPPIDPDHAADLFADLLAKQEVAKDGEGDSAATLWKRFGKETADEPWSAAVTPKIHAAIDAWVHALPEEVGDHVAVVHVECRATLCQILVADNDMDSLNARAESGQEWARASDLLLRQPWWNESGFTGKSYQMTPSDGYALSTTYLMREAGGTPSP